MSAHGASDDNGLGGRLALLHPDELTADQRATYDYLQETKVRWAEESGFEATLPDGRLIGPFNAFLYSPFLGRGYNDWIDAEGAHTSLSPTVRQIIILTVGAVWASAYELYAHTAVGRAAGLGDEAIASIKGGEQPANLSDEEATAYRFAHALTAGHTVGEDLYQEAVAAFGEKGTVDMVHLIGQYMSASALLNAFSVPAPAE